VKKWVINIKYPKNFLDLFEKLHEDFSLNKLYEQNILKNPQIQIKDTTNQIINYAYQNELYNFLAGISFHEFGHSKECPIDTNHFSIIMQSVSTLLEQKSSFNKKLLYYIVNLFTDTIVNTLYGLNDDNVFFRNSMFTFYFSELMQFNSTDISFYYFILLNLKLFQFQKLIRDALETILLPKMPQDHKDKLKKLLNVFCPFKSLINNLMLGIAPTENERWKIINYISERENWGAMAYDFAEIIYEDASKNIIEEHQPVPNSTFTKLFEDNDLFRKLVYDLILKRKLGKEAQKRSHKKIPDAVKNRKKQDPNKKPLENYPGEFDINQGLQFFNPIEKYDGIYRYRSKKMDIFIPKSNQDSKQIISWLNREILTEKDNIAYFDPLNVYFLPKSEELMLFKKSVPLTIDFEGTFSEKGFPNLAIFCDDSGSMTWTPETCEGKYDTLIITIYSLLNWLKNKSFAPVIKYNFVFFSNTTRSTGWMDYFNLEKLKPFLFYHEGGTTKLEPSVFKKILIDPKEKAVILITDGEIFNSQKILKILNDNRNSINFIFIQIGKISKFARTLKNKGYNITQIKNINKLTEIVLNFIKETYKKYD